MGAWKTPFYPRFTQSCTPFHGVKDPLLPAFYTVLYPLPRNELLIPTVLVCVLGVESGIWSLIFYEKLLKKSLLNPVPPLENNVDSVGTGLCKVRYYCCSRTADSRVGKKNLVPRLFFNDVDTSHHCELYHYNIILHSLEAFEACRLILKIIGSICGVSRVKFDRQKLPQPW